MKNLDTHTHTNIDDKIRIGAIKRHVGDCQGNTDEKAIILSGDSLRQTLERRGYLSRVLKHVLKKVEEGEWESPSGRRQWGQRIVV